MQDHKKSLLAGTMIASLALGGAGTAFAAETPQGSDESTSAGITAEAQGGVQTAGIDSASAVEGTFSYTQNVITPNSFIKSVFQKATSALCSATEGLETTNPLGWKLSVTGDVQSAFTATVDELASVNSVKQVMTCTCGGNPADGAAIITADVKGIPVSYLLDRAEAQAGANTLTFILSDGTELSMPLSYVVGRHGVLSYEINDEDLSASVGGNNQLWMTRTPANYFVRDVVEIRVTKEANPPANPGEGMDYPNSPNVGIMAATIN